MNQIENIAARLGIPGEWAESERLVRFPAGPWNVRLLATVMNECEARFMTITAMQLPGSEGFCLEYLWDLKDRVLAFPIVVAGKSIESIAGICEAVNWIECEVHEGYAIEFVGSTYAPLLLRPGDQPGVNLREEAP